MTDLGKRITHMRKHNHMSVMELVEKADITIETLHNTYHENHHTTHKTLNKLAEALNVRVEYLLNGGPEDDLPETAKNEIAANVRNMRKKFGWTRQELADKSGVSVHTLHIIENAMRDVRSEQLVKVACALRTTPEKLMR